LGTLIRPRGSGTGGNDRHAAGRDDPAAPPRSADAPVCGAMLPTTGLTATLRAAITLAAIAALANPKHRPAIGVMAKPKPESNFPMNRHPCM